MGSKLRHNSSRNKVLDYNLQYKSVSICIDDFQLTQHNNTKCKEAGNEKKNINKLNQLMISSKLWCSIQCTSRYIYSAVITHCRIKGEIIKQSNAKRLTTPAVSASVECGVYRPTFQLKFDDTGELDPSGTRS